MTKNSFPERLQQVRIERGLSQTDLANAVNIAPGQINRYESGKNMPRPHLIAKLAGALGVFPDWLTSGSGPRDSGSRSAYSKHLDVHMRERMSGGMDVSMEMDEEIFQIVKAGAEEAGLPIDDYLKELLLEQLKRRSAPPPEKPSLGEIASRLKALEERTQRIADQIQSPSASGTSR